MEFYLDRFFAVKQPGNPDILAFRSFLRALTVPPREMLAPPRTLVIWPKVLTIETVLTDVEGHATSVLLNRKSQTRCWENKRRSDVVREIAGENGYEGAFLSLQETEDSLDVINQTAETDAQFLRRLAKEEGFEFWMDDTGLHWHERRFELTPAHLFTWRQSQKGEILSINVESDLMRRAARVTVKGRDPLAKTTFEESANNDNVDRATLGETREVVELVDPETGDTVLDERNAVTLTYAEPAGNQTRARQKAEKRFKRAERATVKLSMQVVGDPSLRAKSIVEVQGISSILSGKYCVNEVKHTISSSGSALHQL